MEEKLYEKVYRYFLVNRPPSTTVYDGEVNREYWAPALYVEEIGRTAHGYIDYKEPLAKRRVEALEAVPEDRVERAYYHFWRAADGDEQEAEGLIGEYREMPFPHLKQRQDKDPLVSQFLIIEEYLALKAVEEERAKKCPRCGNWCDTADWLGGICLDCHTIEIEEAL